MLARTRLAEIGGLHPRRLVQGARKSLAIPLLFAGLLCAVVPVVYGAVDRSATVPPTAPAPITVPLFTQSTATGSVGHVRVINHATEAGTVRIVAHDDSGLRHGPVMLDIGAGETVHFDAGDLEEGNAEKGFRAGIGTGMGAWRLELTSSLDIEVLSYGRTQEGLVSGMQDVVPQSGSGYRIALFNPASSGGQVSRLRLINPGAAAAAVTIEGIDDDGASPGGAVRLSLPARASRMVTAEELETGDGEGLSGALGDGAGRWRLVVTADRPIEVMNLLASSSSGAMTNLSSGPVAAVDGGDGAATIHAVGLFPSASGADLEGVLRIVNRTRQSGSVSIEAIDDTGTSYGPVTLRIDTLESLVINSDDLEEGNAGKGPFLGHRRGQRGLAPAPQHLSRHRRSVLCPSAGGSGRASVGDARSRAASGVGSSGDAAGPGGDTWADREASPDQSVDDGGGDHHPGCGRHQRDAGRRGAAVSGGRCVACGDGGGS